MWYYLKILVRTSLLQRRNAFRRGGSRAVLGGVVVGGFVLFLGYFITSFVADMTRLAQNGFLKDTAQTLLPNIPGGLLTALLVAMSLFGLTAAIQLLFLAEDLERLMVAPIPLRAVFTYKLGSGLVGQMSMLLFLGMFPLVGYGLGMNFGAAYFLALPIIVLLTALLPTGLGAMLALVLMRLLPSRYARDVLNVFSLIFTGFWLFANQAFRVRSDQAVSALSSLNSPLSPAAWAGGALVAIGQGNVLAALPGLLLFTSVSGLVFIGSLLMAERFFYRGWANLAAAHGGRARRSRSDPGSLTRTILGARVRFATSAGVAVFTKDRRIYLRDTQYLQPLLYSVLLGISWLFSLRGISSADTQGGVGSAVSDLLRAFTPLIAVILCNITAQAIGLGATSREGEGLWHLQIAPLTGKQVAQGKVWLTYLPYLIIGVPYAVIIGVLGHVVWSDVLLSVMALLIIGRGCAAILTWLDIAFPRREWSTPAQQISRTAFWLTWLLLAVYEVPVLVLIYAHRLFEANRAAPMRLTVLLAGLGLAISITWVMEHLLFAQATQRFAAYQDSP